MTPHKNFTVAVYDKGHDSDFHEKTIGSPGVVKPPSGFDDRNMIGFMALTYQEERGYHHVAYIEVHPDYRRQGIASRLYDQAEKISGQKVDPSPLMSEDMRAFWKARTGQTTNAAPRRRPNPLKVDPSRTATLRRLFCAMLRRRFVRIRREVREAIMGYFGPDVVALNVENAAPRPRPDKGKDDDEKRKVKNPKRFEFKTSAERVQAFHRYVKRTVDKELLDMGNAHDPNTYWKAYVEEGFKRGAGRAFDQMHERAKGDPEMASFVKGERYQFLQEAFGQPVAVERVKLLAGRVYTELDGISTKMATDMTRELVDGMTEGKGLVDIADDIVDATDLSEERAMLIARTEIIRAHAEGQLLAMEEMDVDEVGVEVEWSTAGDGRECAACADMAGAVFQLDEAHGMIPRHPNCRCVFIPANVGEKDDGQILSAKDLRSAVEDSLESAGQGKEDTTWAGADAEFDVARPARNEGVENRQFFADCQRDERGWCMPEGSIRSGFSTQKEQTSSMEKARGKIRGAPVPSRSAVRAARRELALAARGKVRAGGEARGGSAASRRRQRENLFNEFGGKEKGYVVCPWTGLRMHWTDDPKLNPKGYPKFERGKIFTKRQGGGYQLPNLIPESFAANRTRNNQPLKKENLE